MFSDLNEDGNDRNIAFPLHSSLSGDKIMDDQRFKELLLRYSLEREREEIKKNASERREQEWEKTWAWQKGEREKRGVVLVYLKLKEFCFGLNW